MKEKKNSGEETLQAIRRNSAYNSSRRISLIFTIAFIIFFLSLTFLYSMFLQPIGEKVFSCILGILTTGVSGICLFHFLQAHYDQSDAMIQVAKFQERSLRKRNDAISLVEKIREEVQEENMESPENIPELSEKKQNENEQVQNSNESEELSDQEKETDNKD